MGWNRVSMVIGSSLVLVALMILFGPTSEIAQAALSITAMFVVITVLWIVISRESK